MRKNSRPHNKNQIKYTLFFPPLGITTTLLSLILIFLNNELKYLFTGGKLLGY